MPRLYLRRLCSQCSPSHERNLAVLQRQLGLFVIGAAVGWRNAAGKGSSDACRLSISSNAVGDERHALRVHRLAAYYLMATQTLLGHVISLGYLPASQGRRESQKADSDKR